MSLTKSDLVSDLERQYLTVNDDVLVGGREFNILRPRSAEDLISEADFEIDERLPYWAELWPSSTILAKYILQNKVEKGHTIELGCGVGLVTLAAAAAGNSVTATDYYEPALRFTEANALRNEVEIAGTQLLDWRNIPDDIGTYDLVLASDVLYESQYADIVAAVINRVLSKTGIALIADPGRIAIENFKNVCVEMGMTVNTASQMPFQAGKIRQTITIYSITK